MKHPVERLRRIWTPGREIVEVVHALDPQTELDSMLRDFLHRALQQKGPVTLLLEFEGQTIPNTGTLCWETVHFEPTPGTPGHREVSLWIEPETGVSA